MENAGLNEVKQNFSFRNFRAFNVLMWIMILR